MTRSDLIWLAVADEIEHRRAMLDGDATLREIVFVVKLSADRRCATIKTKIDHGDRVVNPQGGGVPKSVPKSP